MSIQSILNFITNKNYITSNNEISVANYFRGDINEYNQIGNNYINYFINNFYTNRDIKERSIIIKDNNLWFYIEYRIDNNDNNNNNNDNNEIYWDIYIADNLNKLNNRVGRN
jgi:hypothetical protein